jgi:hypothetical protein
MPHTSASRLLPVILLTAALLSGCGPKAAVSSGLGPGVSREEGLHRLVQTYDVRLAEGFKKQDMNTLNKVATEDQATTEYYQMAALGEGKVRLLSTPKSVRFLSTAFSSTDTATVETEETWDYVQVSTETSAVLRTEKGVVYRLRYVIVRRDGRWLVDSVKETRSPSGDGQGTKPGAARPQRQLPATVTRSPQVPAPPATPPARPRP